MNFIKGLFTVIIPILTLDAFFLFQDVYAKRDASNINKMREKQFGEGFIPLKPEEVKSKLTTFVIFFSMVLSILYVAFGTDLWSKKQYLEIFKKQYVYYALILMFYLNIKIIITNIKRFIKQIKGEL